MTPHPCELCGLAILKPWTGGKWPKHHSECFQRNKTELMRKAKLAREAALPARCEHCGRIEGSHGHCVQRAEEAAERVRLWLDGRERQKAPGAFADVEPCPSPDSWRSMQGGPVPSTRIERRRRP